MKTLLVSYGLRRYIAWIHTTNHQIDEKFFTADLVSVPIPFLSILEEVSIHDVEPD